MKKIVPALLIIVIFLSNKQPDSKSIYDLSEAVELKLVEFKIDGRNESPHYAQPAHLLLKNLTDETVNVRVRNGQQLVSNPTTIQDLIIVNEELLILAAGATEEMNLYAMCTEHQYPGPNKSTNYSLGEMATDPLKSLTKEIQKRKDYNTLGQYSVWAIANDEDIGAIAGYDEPTAEHYQKFVSDLTGRPMPVKDTNDYLTNYNNSGLSQVTIRGSFEYGLSATSSITIGMFDEEDIIVRELLNKPDVGVGDHKFDFEFDALAYTEPVYYVRLIIDGDIRLNLKMEM